MLKRNIQSSRKNEKGIALIFSLIFLSLLLILALSFALDSMFDQKAAYNSANASSAGLLAKTQLNQILTLIKNNEAKYDTDGKLYSHDINSATDTDMLVDRFKNDVDTNAGWFPRIQWNYIRNGNAPTDRIVGRTAFVVIPDDQLPLDSLVSKTVDESGGATAGVFNEERIGKEVSEINVRYPLSTLTPGMADILNWDESQAGVTSARTAGTYKGSWNSYDEIFGANVLDLETAISNITDRDNFKEDFMKTFKIDGQKDREAFWGDKNNDGVWDGGEYFRRFNLTRTDWDTNTWQEDLDFINDEILMKPDSSGIPNVGMQEWKTTDANTKVSGLPWIACFGYNDDGTGLIHKSLLGNYDNVVDQRAQIAANLKDYCDNDKDSGANLVIRPTSDVDPATWVSGASIPTFTGNEKTPYINKIAVQIDAYRYSTTSSGTTTFTGKVKATPYVELINIFPDAFDETSLKNLRIRIEGSVRVHVSASGMMGDYYREFPFDQDLDVGSFWTDLNGGTGYCFLPGTSTAYKDVPDGTTDPYYISSNSEISITMDVEWVKVTKVVLYYEFSSIIRGYDYVKELQVDSSGLSGIFVGTSTTPSYCWYGWAVDDPRQNLNQGDWKLMKCEKGNYPEDVLSISGGTGTEPEPYLGAANAANSSNGTSSTQVDTISPGNSLSHCDQEDGVTDPADGNLSTAYIRNAPMESPWELGCIHRGFMWQTLNLKVYRKEKAIKTFSLGAVDDLRYYIPGGGQYVNGDANILDQIKMTAESESPEKINLRSESTDDMVLKALFKNVQIGCPQGTATGGTAIAEDVYASLVEGKYPTASENDMRTRASVVDVLVPGGATNDAMREEIIGKVINLTKIEELGGSGFTAYVLAQTIKDVGGPNSGSGIPFTKISDAGNTKTKANCKIGQFDSDVDTTDSTNSVYFDEITAEQKIEVKGVVSNGKVKITSFQYID